jgi:molybdopterin synthase sulfur carrier subunit
MSGQTLRDRPNEAMEAAVLVRLPPHLVVLFPGAERRVSLAASSVNEMVDALDALWPGMRERICDETPAIRRHINVFVDGRRAKLETTLRPGADVFVLTAISGG